MFHHLTINGIIMVPLYNHDNTIDASNIILHFLRVINFKKKFFSIILLNASLQKFQQLLSRTRNAFMEKNDAPTEIGAFIHDISLHN